MLISYRWLQRHVDLSGITPEQLALDLTLSTAEVEGIEPFAPHLSAVVVGLVKTRERHPDADKLNVCTVDVGSGEDLQIVCGAPNVDAGLKVAVATVGTVLPGDFKIKKSKIRGVASVGMICSVRELDLGDEHDGIWVLPEEAEVGKPVAEALGADDWLIEIDNKSITHRPDLWGHRGMARELAAIYKRELKPLDLSLPETGNAAGVPVTIESDACSRYLALAVDGVKNEPSPFWLKTLLLAAGQRPLDLLVDLSNFVMLDLGQPNHLFDRSCISDAGINVRMARAGEAITTLDGEERKLGASDLLITSSDAPLALAGVMGGEASKVEADTGALVLEVASFDAVTIRRTSSRIGLRTDSSARFEKSLDPNLPIQAAAHLVRTLREIQPDIVLPSAPTDVGQWNKERPCIELRGARVRKILGVELTDDEIAAILRSIDFGVEVKDGVLQVEIPTNRATKDIAIEVDLIEEVGRLFRYDNIAERRLQGEIAPPPHDERREMVTRMQDRLSGGAAFHEVLCYSFVAGSLLEKLGVLDLDYTRLVNPVVEGEDRIRRSVIPSLLGLLEKNRRHHQDVRLFEIGKGYFPERSDESGLPGEVHELGLVWTRPAPGKKARFDAGLFPHMRGVLDDLFSALGYEMPCWSAPAEGSDLAPWFHPGHTLIGEWRDAETKGKFRAPVVVGKLEPGLHKPLGIDQELAGEVVVAQISLDELLASKRQPLGYRPIPRFPGNKVDVALAMPIEVPAADLVKAIEKSGKGQVASVELFDLYRGPGLGEGKKSLAYHVLLQSDQKTLTDKDAAKFIKRLERAAQELGGELRSE
ncbi:MAG: phenylalanyl-tRNA synthetase beta chain [Planctomycetota bacterium]|jgi:phenylalanyl-tRNA synthetase beta chain